MGKSIKFSFALILLLAIVWGLLIIWAHKVNNQPPKIEENQLINNVDTSTVVSIFDLLQAIEQVESSKNPKAINIKENAIGILQIRQCMLDQANRISGKHYELNDCLDPFISIDIFMIIQRKYNKNMDFERAARIWNGWLNYDKKPKTIEYYNKVLLALNN